MKLHRNMTKLSVDDIEPLIKEVKRFRNTLNPTAEDTFEYLLDNKLRDNFYSVYKYDPLIKRSWLQRVNLFWVYPVFIITIPLQYIFTGRVGLNSNTFLGRLVNHLVKID